MSGSNWIKRSKASPTSPAPWTIWRGSLRTASRARRETSAARAPMGPFQVRLAGVGGCAILWIPMSRKAVVFGSAGQLGLELVRTLQERGYAVEGWDRAEVDITDAAAVETALAGCDPEVVYNAAAYNQVDVAEKEPRAAFLVNALAVRNLALACRQVDARLIHFSPDYVFDGFARHPYAEDDATHPLSAYAVSKLAGELYAQAYLDLVLVVRTSGAFCRGGLNPARGNFVELM